MAQRVRGLAGALTGFMIAFAGLIVGFIRLQFEMRWLAVSDCFIIATGVFVGFAGILYGWFTEEAKALIGSGDAMRNLSTKIA